MCVAHLLVHVSHAHICCRYTASLSNAIQHDSYLHRHILRKRLQASCFFFPFAGNLLGFILREKLLGKLLSIASFYGRKCRRAGEEDFHQNFGSFYVSWKLPTYPSPKPTLTLSSYLEQNVGLGEGQVSGFTET